MRLNKIVNIILLFYYLMLSMSYLDDLLLINFTLLSLNILVNKADIETPTLLMYLIYSNYFRSKNNLEMIRLKYY